jgi:homoserine O-acetyltransferase
MAALLTYRSRDSFESRFGRKSGAPAKRGRGGALASSGRSRPTSPPLRSRAPGTPREDAWRAHNDGYRARLDSAASLNGSSATTPTTEGPQVHASTVDVINPAKPDQPDASVAQKLPEVAFQNAPLTNLELSMPGGSRSRTPQPADGKLGTGASRTPQVFSAQSYLRYQGDKVSSE